MKRIIFLMTVLAVTGMLGCSKTEKLSDKFNEDEVKKASHDVIELVSANEYDKLVDEQFNAIMKANLTAEKLVTDVQPIVEELGAFKEFDKETVIGNTDKESGEEMAVAVVIVKYEKKKAQYTVTFDSNMKVAGLFIK